MKNRIGIICPSEIAFRRFLPALQKASDDFVFAAIGIASPSEWFEDLSVVTELQINEQQEREMAKAKSFVEGYGGRIVVGYEQLLNCDDIDSVYIPLPPALHYKWAKIALQKGKHVFVEKPSTCCLKDTKELVDIASSKGLALHENYMFVYHSQIYEINKAVSEGIIGDIRLYRISFGFPLRDKNDFRYNKKLGGGAILDAGGYCLKLARLLLGETTKVVTATSNFIKDFETDMFGSATLLNDSGLVAQVAFGMDNDYHCKLEIWGSKGTITSDRILTAPVGYVPTMQIKQNQSVSVVNLHDDDAFYKSILKFRDCIYDENVRMKEYQFLIEQEELLEQFYNNAL